jgi:hypothetical protein
MKRVRPRPVFGRVMTNRFDDAEERKTKQTEFSAIRLQKMDDFAKEIRNNPLKENMVQTGSVFPGPNWLLGG